MTPEDIRDIIREEVGEDLKLLRHHITGNGTPERGLIMRLDRLEQTEVRRGRWVNTAVGASVVAVVGTLWKLLTGGTP